MNRRPNSLTAFALFLAAGTALFAKPSAPQRDGKTIDRFPPSSFHDLPESFRKILEQRGCAIPQAFQEPQKPNNVIRGEFAQTGQRDWAVLCSKGESSSIVVFLGRAGDVSCRIGGIPRRELFAREWPGAAGLFTPNRFHQPQAHDRPIGSRWRRWRPRSNQLPTARSPGNRGQLRGQGFGNSFLLQR